MPPIMYQALTYRSESRALRNGRTNSKTIRTKARTTKASTTSGNSAHSQRLAETGSYQHPSREDNRKIPDPEEKPSKPAAQNRPICKAWHDIIKERQKRVAQPSEKYALRVVVAKPAPGKPSVAS